MKKLAVFDFDHTILDDNSDTAVCSLTDKSKIPNDIKQIQYTDGWTAFMQAVFSLLHSEGVTTESIKELIVDLPPVSGMIPLIETLHNKQVYDMIIISDANSLFIQHWLERHNLAQYFLKVFTNPAEIVNGKLIISPFHHQETCKLSTVNLCKGQIMDEFIQTQRQKAVVYDQVVYIGDGVNDFCPILRLRENDLGCARKNYNLVGLIEKAKNGASLDNSGKPQVVKSEIFVWDTGDDIINRLELKQ